MKQMARSIPVVAVAGGMAGAGEEQQSENSDRPSKRSKQSKDDKTVKLTSIRQSTKEHSNKCGGTGNRNTSDKNKNINNISKKDVFELTKTRYPFSNLYSDACNPYNAFGFGDSSSDTSNDDMEIQRCLDSPGDGNDEGNDVFVSSMKQDSSCGKNADDAIAQLPIRSHMRRYVDSAKSRNPHQAGFGEYISPFGSPALSNDMLQTVQLLFNRPLDRTIHEKFGMDLKVRDLRNFYGSTWLEDRVINFYLEMVKARNNKEQSRLPRVFVFHAEIVKMYVESNFHYIGVIDKSADPDDIFEYDLLFFPIHSAEHWSLVCVDTVNKQVTGYDSLGRDLAVFVKGIVRYIVLEYNKLRNLESAHNEQHSHSQQKTSKNRTSNEYFQGWRKTHLAKNLPRQQNCNDCGIFILQFAEYLSRREDFNFSQVHMRYFRERMAFEVIQGKLLDVPNLGKDADIGGDSDGGSQ